MVVIDGCFSVVVVVRWIAAEGVESVTRCLPFYLLLLTLARLCLLSLAFSRVCGKITVMWAPQGLARGRERDC